MLNIFMRFKRGILVVRLKGILDKATVSLLRRDVNSIIKNNGIKYVLLNLEYLYYIDDNGHSAINDVYKEIIKNNGKLILCGVHNLFGNKQVITENLYQVCEEDLAYEMVKI